MRVRSTSSHTVNCLTSKGKHTSMMHVYKHWVLLRFSSILTGMSMAPPIAPTQPKQSFRQDETLLTWLSDPKSIHNLTFKPITDAESTHCAMEKSHT